MEIIKWDTIRELVLKMSKNNQSNLQQTISIKGEEYDFEVNLTKKHDDL